MPYDLNGNYIEGDCGDACISVRFAKDSGRNVAVALAAPVLCGMGCGGFGDASRGGLCASCIADKGLEEFFPIGGAPEALEAAQEATAATSDSEPATAAVHEDAPSAAVLQCEAISAPAAVLCADDEVPRALNDPPAPAAAVASAAALADDGPAEIEGPSINAAVGCPSQPADDSCALPATVAKPAVDYARLRESIAASADAPKRTSTARKRVGHGVGARPG